MILLDAIVVSVVIGLLRGGRLARLAELRFAHGWLVLAAVALQYPLVSNLVGNTAIIGVPLAFPMMAVSLLLVLAAVWTNRRLPGVPLIGLGLLLNLAVMACNGGWMPMTPEALTRMGRLWHLTPQGDVPKVWGAKNVALSRAETRLWWLSDIFVIVAPFPFRAAFSIGDVFVAAGLFWLLQQALLGRASRPAAEGAARGEVTP